MKRSLLFLLLFAAPVFGAPPVIPDPYGHYPDGLRVVGVYPDGRGLIWCVPAKYPDLENVLLKPAEAKR